MVIKGWHGILTGETRRKRQKDTKHIEGDPVYWKQNCVIRVFKIYIYIYMYVCMYMCFILYIVAEVDFSMVFFPLMFPLVFCVSVKLI